jgi:hypothetical protein
MIRFQDSKIPGFQDSRIPRFQDSRFHVLQLTNNSEYMHAFPLRVVREAGLAIFPKSRISFNNNHDFSVLV